MPYAVPDAGRRDDRGLAAVARVRGVAEQRSVLELRRALTDRDARRAVAERLSDQLGVAAESESRILASGGDPGTLITLRTSLVQLAESTRAARERVSAAEEAVDIARERWRQDRARLRAVEHLLERRTAARAVNARRAEDRRSDEVAAGGWLRTRTGGDR
jgi:flagellar export protein FliJ